MHSVRVGRHGGPLGLPACGCAHFVWGFFVPPLCDLDKCITASHLKQLHFAGSRTARCQCSCASCVVLEPESSLLFGTTSVSRRSPPSEVPAKLPNNMCVGECACAGMGSERCCRAAATILGHFCGVRRVSVRISGKASVPSYVPVGRCHT